MNFKNGQSASRTISCLMLLALPILCETCEVRFTKVFNINDIVLCNKRNQDEQLT